MWLDAAQHNHHMTLCPAAAGLEGTGQLLLPVRERKTRVVQLDGTELQLQRVPLRNYIRWAHLALWPCTAHIWRYGQHPRLFKAASRGQASRWL